MKKKKEGKRFRAWKNNLYTSPKNTTASAQVITHYLKLGTTREQLEKEKLRKENELLRAKTESIDASRRDDDFYEKVMSAIQRYSGNFFGMGEEETEGEYDD